jgi:F0F1-type ATP synthase membrane subunit c/vacuolar-type H+-ATPase subunit K
MLESFIRAMREAAKLIEAIARDSEMRHEFAWFMVIVLALVLLCSLILSYLNLNYLHM